MAANKDNNNEDQQSLLNTNVTRPASGVFTECHPSDQPKGTKRFHLNGINRTRDGVTNFGSNEEGNQLCTNLPNGYIILGKIYMNYGRIGVLSVAKDESSSEIGWLDRDCNYTTVVNTPDLGFKLNHQIDVRYRLRRGCEDVIYFVDGLSVRFFNFSELKQFYSDAYLAFLNAGSGSFTGNIWDASKFNLFPTYKVPCFTSLEVLTGGSLTAGTFNFSIRYLDSDLNPTNWIYTSQLVPIYQSDISGEYGSINGSSNSLTDQLAGIPNTNKSVKITLGNLDTKYRYYQIAVVTADNGTGNVTKVIISPEYPINNTTYIFDGNTEGYTTGTSPELLLPKTDISSAEHIEQLENKLLLLSVKGKQVSYCGFQKFASKIASNYIIKEIPQNVNELVDGDAKHPNTYWDTQGYMGDEIYAMGIIYVFNDGLESPVFHIPGRPPGQYYKATDGTIHTTTDQNIIGTWVPDVAPWYSDPALYNSLSTGAKVKRWKVYDTSVKYSPGGEPNSYGAMGYHENLTSTYTKLDDCSGDDSFWGQDCCGNDLEGTPVRHHRFPSRFSEPHVRSGTDAIANAALYLDVSLISGESFPGSPPTITVDYEVNGIPDSYNLTITSDMLPISKLLIVASTGDFNTIDITSVTTTMDSAVFDYDVYRDIQNSGSVTGSILRILGIQFSNVEYPHPDIVGHYFVRGPRDNENRTVLDKGYANNMRKKVVNGTTYTSFGYFCGDQNAIPNDNYLFTPRFCFNKDVLEGDYIRVENEAINSSNFSGSKTYDGKGSIFSETDSVIEYRLQNYVGVDTTYGDKSYAVSKSMIMDAIGKNSEYDGPGAPVFNLSWTNRLNVVTTTSPLPRHTKNMPYVGYKVIRDIHPVLSQIEYQRMHNCMLSAESTNKVYGGDTFISRWDIATSLYSRKHKGIASTILAIVLIAAAAVATIVTVGATAPILAAAIGGAAAAAAAAGVATAVYIAAIFAAAIGITGQSIQYITDQTNGDLGQLAHDQNLSDTTDKGVTLSSYIVYANDAVMNLFVESDVNVGLRQPQNNPCGSFITYGTDPTAFFRDKWLYLDQKTNKYLPKGLACPECYWYNLDYSRQNVENQYESLPDSYNCCSDCNESHPQRAQYSLESFQEEVSDNYRVFPANNYRDIEGEHGAITNAFKRNNNLFINTSEGLWILPQNQQQQINGELITFIGTGEFFSIPPKKLSDSVLGSMGTQHKWATVATPQGVIIVNEAEGRIYLLGDKFEEISLPNKTYFKNNLKDFFANQFYQLTGKEFPNQNNPANPYGIGIHTGYDEFYNRVIITKRDYLLLPQYQSGFETVQSQDGVMPSLAPGRLVFDLTLNKFIVAGSSTTNYTIIGFDSTAYFENKSWTFSYDLLDNQWISWHSYLPNFYLFNHDNIYMSHADDSGIYRHNTPGLYHSYFGKSFPYILEVAIAADPISTKYWEDIAMQTIARKFNSGYGEYTEQRGVTFNKLIAYNERQSTGELNLMPKANISEADFMNAQISNYDNQTVLLSRKEDDWHLNDLRDYRSDYTTPIFTRDWSILKSQYFIDKIIDSSIINYNKDWDELEVLRDKYIILRLKFDNFTDVQLVTKYLLDTTGISQ